MAPNISLLARVILLLLVLLQVVPNGSNLAAVARRMTVVSNGNKGSSDYMISISQSDSDEDRISARLMQVTGSGPGVVVHLRNQETDPPLTHPDDDAHFHTPAEGGQEIIQGRKEPPSQTSSSLKDLPIKINMGSQATAEVSHGKKGELSDERKTRKK